MKYIRTQDGVYELISNLDNKNRMNVKAKTCFSYVLIAKSSIVAQADTIEELCDCKVIVDNRFSPIPMLFTMPLSDIIDTVGPNGYDAIYGAIFTDRGIIYVAKMNDKGDLELL